MYTPEVVFQLKKQSAGKLLEIAKKYDEFADESVESNMHTIANKASKEDLRLAIQYYGSYMFCKGKEDSAECQGYDIKS